MDTNYTPDEIRLLDEFAKAAMGFLIEDSPRERVASWSYDTAAAMIAERQKRVGANPTLCPQSPTTAAFAAILPAHQMDAPVVEPVAQPEPIGTYKGVPVYAEPLRDTRPVAQPEPEKGELTEEAITKWNNYARNDPVDDCGGHWLSVWEIDRAVALMREGLAAKQTAEVLRHKVADLQRTVEQGADDLRAADESIVMAKRERDEARHLLNLTRVQVGAKEGDRLTPAVQSWISRAEKAEKERDEARDELERERMRLAACGVLAGCNTEDSLAKNLAMHPDYMSSSAQSVADAMRREMALRARAERSEAALSEVQPVLDAVASSSLFEEPRHWLTKDNSTIQAYADRRREQAKGAS